MANTITFGTQWVGGSKAIYANGNCIGSIERVDSREFDVNLDFQDEPRTLSTEANAKHVASKSIANHFRVLDKQGMLN